MTTRTPLLWRALLLLASGAVLAAAAWAVRGHERTLAIGDTVYLSLAPVDPRSIMQGDYMTLRYAEEDALNDYLHQAHGRGAFSSPPRYARLRLDAQRRATFIDAGNAPQAAADTISMRIHYNGQRALLGPNAFFFQEGTAATYEAAAWGVFRVAPQGQALLVGLLDPQLKPLGPSQY